MHQHAKLVQRGGGARVYVDIRVTTLAVLGQSGMKPLGFRRHGGRPAPAAQIIERVGPRERTRRRARAHVRRSRSMRQPESLFNQICPALCPT